MTGESFSIILDSLKPKPYPMKKLLVLAIAGFLFSCSKEDETTPSLPPILSGTIVFDEEHSELGLGSYHAVNVYQVEDKKLSKIIFPFEPGQSINYNDPYLSPDGSGNDFRFKRIE